MTPLFGETTYAYPQVFWGLLLLPIVILWSWRQRCRLSLPISSLQLLQGLSRSWRTRGEFFPYVLQFLGGVFLVYALAMPQIVNEKVEVHTEGVDMLLAIDTSASMYAEDMEIEGNIVNRMVMVKSVVAEFVKNRAYDQIGMVVFGDQAYTQCPLTLDHDILNGYLEMIEVGIAGDATAIGNALAMSVRRLLDSKAKSKIVILLTDGENTAGEVSPRDAMKLASEKGVKVYTIAVGSKQKRVRFPVKTFFGIQYRQVELPVDEDLLREIAQKTNGQFFRADSTETLREIYRRIDALEKSKIDVQKFTETVELFDRPLALAFVLILLAYIFQNTVFLRVP